MMKSSAGRAKKKLEITVLDARPMSQSAFVDQHSAQKRGTIGEWSLTYGKLHPSQSASNLTDEKDSLVGLGDNSETNDLTSANKRPTIIRPSKSNDNLKGSAYRVDTSAAYSTSDLFRPQSNDGTVPFGAANVTLPRQQPGAIVNPGFRLESDKRVPAPPRPRKRQPPPRPPPMRAGVRDSTARRSVFSELEGIFSTQSATNPVHAPPKPLRANSRNSSRPTSLVRPILTVPHCVALHDFEADNDGDLSIKAGDTIRLIEMREDQWYSGCNLRTQKEGLFPSNFVEVKVPLVATETVSQPQSYPKPKPRSLSLTSSETSANSSTTATRPFGMKALKPTVSDSCPPPPRPQSIKSLWPPPSEPPPPPPVSSKPPISGRSMENPSVAPKPARTTPVATVNPEPITGKVGTFRNSFWPPPSSPSHNQPSPPTSPPPILTSKPKLAESRSLKARAAQCRAIYAYDSGVAEDLKFEAGATIQILEQLDAEWLKGELRGRVGIFPKIFVEIEQDLPSLKVKHVPEPVVKIEPKVQVLFEVRAIYDYNGLDGDLSFKAGETIKVTKVVSNDWMEGEISHRQGLFPSNFVEKPQPSMSPPPPPPPPKQLPKARALYGFQAQTAGDLTFQENDIIMLKEEIDAEWLRGEVNGCVGIFPKSFVNILVPL